MAGNAESIILEEEIDENYEPSQEGELTPAWLSARASDARASTPHLAP